MPEISFKGTRFDGDGRVKLAPSVALPETNPLRITRSGARDIIERFHRNRVSSHSTQAGTLWVLLEWCQVKQLCYTLAASPNYGYVLTMKDFDHA